MVDGGHGPAVRGERYGLPSGSASEVERPARAGPMQDPRVGRPQPTRASDSVGKVDGESRSPSARPQEFECFLRAIDVRDPHDVFRTGQFAQSESEFRCRDRNRFDHGSLPYLGHRARVEQIAERGEHVASLARCGENGELDARSERWQVQRLVRRMLDMMKLKVLAAVLCAGMLLVGCQGDANDDTEAANGGATTTATQQIVDGVLANLNGEPICPVMNRVVATADDAYTIVEHDGYQIYICCAGCPEKFKEDPDRYLDLP